MNHAVVRVTAISAMTIISQSAVSRSAAKSNSTEIKHILVPMPKGLVNAEARNVEKDWTTPMVHLKGNVYVRIYTATKSPSGAINMMADEVDLNQTTGEISPRGNVRLIVDDIK